MKEAEKISKQTQKVIQSGWEQAADRVEKLLIIQISTVVVKIFIGNTCRRSCIFFVNRGDSTFYYRPLSAH